MNKISLYSLRVVREATYSYPLGEQSSTSSAAYNALRSILEDCAEERLVVLILDTKRKIIGAHTVAIGGLNSAHVRIADILKPVIIQNGDSFILSHNHPSGDPTPSVDDVKLTEAVRDAAKMIDVELLDHIVIGENKFVSMRERNLIQF